MKIVAITQARYGSTRLPAKILKEVSGKTLLEIHLERILMSKLVDKLTVATTNEIGSEKIISIAQKYNLNTYQGSVNDVLDRFYNAALIESPDYIVRITSDCPFIDPIVIDRVIDVCITSNNDYVSNTLHPTYPDGIDVEVFTFKSLERAYNEASLKSDREHVTPYIWKNSSFKGGTIFKSDNVSNEKDYSNYRITVDTLDDYMVIKALIQALGIDKPWIDYINYLERNPDIRQINDHYKRNEGYSKSILND
jgi:Spore coat polysaccharide biosynthesis protein F, CMP-KDO synthetase homolog